MRYVLAYLVCLQIMVNNVYIAHCLQLIDCGIKRNNLYYWTMKDIRPSLPR